MAEANGGDLPHLDALAQYVKDLSFENPNAPRSLGPQETAPNIAIQVNVNAKPLQDGNFEVELMFEGTAGEGENILFRFDLNYAGVFHLSNIPQQHVHQVLMIECPRMMFPFARAVLANAVRDGGFPPFLLQPIDFAALYQARVNELAQQGAPANS
ncbi:MAG: protein-export chaperone SecB [Hyphomicrobiales bacterium]|uniref:protein-export chaperone SecB n=1 Tax=Rhabdaerophilum calidifontis TaxID=2604328 RepID=UPI00123ACEB6|nr:protein-export chaperone SecB [Rhabdaerophilum calidifontis]MCA1952419.1 protein-export chaperone SecB [Hyphomicrobiales bacterium]MCA1999079.1 protein-export chaperone SecB [Hyphomicrobiales bacterium]